MVGYHFLHSSGLGWTPPLVATMDLDPSRTYADFQRHEDTPTQLTLRHPKDYKVILKYKDPTYTVQGTEKRSHRQLILDRTIA